MQFYFMVTLWPVENRLWLSQWGKIIMLLKSDKITLKVQVHFVCHYWKCLHYLFLENGNSSEDGSPTWPPTTTTTTSLTTTKSVGKYTYNSITLAPRPGFAIVSSNTVEVGRSCDFVSNWLWRDCDVSIAPNFSMYVKFN